MLSMHIAVFRCEKYVNMTVAVPRDSGLYDYGGNLIDKPALTKEIDSTIGPSADPSPEPPTLGQVMKATEDLLKIMMTISPGTSPNQSKVDDDSDGKKKKDKTKKKERKNKKGKGLKGKRKNQLKKENVDSPAKEIWGKNTVKDGKAVPENQPLDILEGDPKQDPFNDILNDEPIRNNEAKTPTPMMPTYKMEELKAKVTSPPPESRPCTRKPQRKNRQERKGRRERKKKPNTESCGPSNTQ